ncbi:hypothetical protein [Pararoseomonas baculiformis]|uniref:hypothetical protein n=1 Tax=Pararoseomonas baculiformis TaxID=2820812 RepID=UPI001ADEC031|nr:hypothetical protein [Pararoseomonas baculiformis]
MPGTDDPLRFAGALLRVRLTISLSKFSIWNVFDNDRSARDIRTEFSRSSVASALSRRFPQAIG